MKSDQNSLDEQMNRVAEIVYLIKKFSAANREMLERLESGQYSDEDLKMLEQFHKSFEQARDGLLETVSHEELIDL